MQEDDSICKKQELKSDINWKRLFNGSRYSLQLDLQLSTRVP